MELFISACIIIMIAVLTVITLKEYIVNTAILYQEDVLEEYLQKILSFVVGIEFVKMLIQHNPGSVIEVLIFATSRQMIAEHTDGIETIIRIIAIGILFAIQRFIILPRTKEDPLSEIS